MSRVFAWWTVLLMIWGLTSCTGDRSETINERYLKTSKYQSFKLQAEAEIQQNLRRHRQLGGYVRQFSNCSNVRLFSGDFTITRQQIDTLKTSSAPSNTTCAITSTLNEVRFRLSVIGKTELSDLKVLWLILDLQAAYEDYQLLAVTFRKKVMIDFGAIGVFKRNLSEQLMSKVQVLQRGDHIDILSTTERTIKHPIEQNYSVQQNYRIGPDGIVKQLQ